MTLFYTLIENYYSNFRWNPWTENANSVILELQTEYKCFQTVNIEFAQQTTKTLFFEL